MRIALVGYEYPPDTAFGGIATYTQQWATLLSKKGCEVEVFCGSPNRNISEVDGNVWIHRIKISERSLFKTEVVNKFVERNHISPFDLIESPELNSDAQIIKRMFPDIKLIVKLHCPTFLIRKLDTSWSLINFLREARFIVGALRRFTLPKEKFVVNRTNEIEEKEFVLNADIVTCPSKSLIQIVKKKWKYKSELFLLPNPYVPSRLLLENKIFKGKPQLITYIGRLERRKGIFSFIKIIPKVLNDHPEVKFQFIGSDTFDTVIKGSVRDYLKKRLYKYAENLIFQGQVTLEEIPTFLRKNTICVFPSIWENFPTVCLEAMSAGRAVIGSERGGMAEMLVDDSGILVDPKNYAQIISAINVLLKDDDLRIRLSGNARKSVLTKYNEDIVFDRFEAIVKKRK